MNYEKRGEGDSTRFQVIRGRYGGAGEVYKSLRRNLFDGEMFPIPFDLASDVFDGKRGISLPPINGESMSIEWTGDLRVVELVVPRGSRLELRIEDFLKGKR